MPKFFSLQNILPLTVCVGYAGYVLSDRFQYHEELREEILAKREQQRTEKLRQQAQQQQASTTTTETGINDKEATQRVRE
mmetsp:Transcript_46070/g.62673  ORF Transcript_46070/g.62673 Transcript_46070/m.62673 type:complete len:80 (+) Transcript_46070:23-262(+)